MYSPCRLGTPRSLKCRSTCALTRQMPASSGLIVNSHMLGSPSLLNQVTLKEPIWRLQKRLQSCCRTLASSRCAATEDMPKEITYSFLAALDWFWYAAVDHRAGSMNRTHSNMSM